MHDTNFISLAGYFALIVGAALTIFSRIPKETITNYEQLSLSQERRIKALEDQSKKDRQNHVENIRAIADLQGQIKVYKELPLQDMAMAMKDISVVNQGIADSNREILKTLRASSLIAAEDRDILTNQTQVVAEQTVEHQTIKHKR